MTRRAVAVAIALCGAIQAAPSPAAAPAGTQAHPSDAARAVVVAELFTSEGCSSCPPADALLRRLLATQPIEGVEIVALGYHVDYWDRLGWRDPFSSPRFSERQSAYASAVFRSGEVYTPQLVVDGALQCVASDAGAVRRTILEAASRPLGALSVSARLRSATRAEVVVRTSLPGTRLDGPAEVMLAVTEDGLASHVSRGENRGRTLLLDAVVRRLLTAGRLAPSQPDAGLSTAITLDPDWNPAKLQVVAFVQEVSSRRIVAAGLSAFR